MRIGLFGDAGASVTRAIQEAKLADAEGFDSYWLPQVMGLDSMTTLALAGTETNRIELATAVHPIQIRHPFALASQALSTQAACSGRFTLGLGLSHKPVVEGMWGKSFDRPLHQLSEYLDATLPLLHGEAADFRGDTVTSVGSVTVETTVPPPVLLAALGPRMLAIAGERAAGTITWCTGPRTLKDHVIPTITAAAEAAGRREPRIVVALPLAITDDPERAIAQAAKVLGFYAALPSYRAMLDREGVAGPEELALVGSEEEVGEALEQLAASGVTDFGAAAIPTRDGDQRSRTREFLRGLNL